MLEKLFLQVLNMSFTGGVVITLVLLARLLLKKAPKVFSYALWAVVLFRLVCPFSFESVLSLLPTNAAPISEGIVYMQAPRVNTGIAVLNNAVSSLLPAATPDASINPLQLWVFFGGLFWLAGVGALLGYSLLTLLRLRRRLKSATPRPDGVFISDQISTAFVMGIFRPKIYLPNDLSDTERSYILLHEQTHIRRLDHLVKLVSFLVLCVHWFNPLVWAAFFFSGKDMELSCDEAVIGRLGSEVKKDYSTSLLTLATERRIVGGTPLAFGEGDTKGRIKNVLSYKKPALWVIVVAVAAVACLVIGLMANPKERLGGEPPSLGEANAAAIRQKSGEQLPGGYSAEALWASRTEYIGNNAAVGKLLGLLPVPAGFKYDHFALQTSGQPYGLEIFYSVPSESLAKLDSEYIRGNEAFRRNSLLLLALVDNAAIVKTILTDGNREILSTHDREWAELTTGGELRDYAQSPEKLQQLIDFPLTANGDSDVAANYSISRLSQSGGESFGGFIDNAELAQNIIFNFLVRSQVQPGIDISTLEECYRIRQTFSENGEVHDYYAFRLAGGAAVLQNGADGFYAALPEELYAQLEAFSA